jgi:hypothetical protein
VLTAAEAPVVPPKSGTKQADERARCVNGLLLQATARGVASFVGLPPTEPSLGDLAGLVKDTVNSPPFKVAAIYTATKIAKQVATKQVASRFAAKIGSTFVPGVGELAGAIIVGQAVWDGFSWYKDQIEGGACEVP